MTHKKVNPLARALAQKWQKQEQENPTRHCQNCGSQQPVRQEQRDEVCVYVCETCGSTIDESQIPF